MSSLLVGMDGVGKRTFLDKMTSLKTITKSSWSEKNNVKILVLNQNMSIILSSHKNFSTLSQNHNIKSLLFMIDSTNRSQSSSSLVLLLRILSDNLLFHLPILIIINKFDSPEAMNRKEVERYFHLQNIIKCRGTSLSSPPIGQMKVIECSSLDATGLPHVFNWLKENNQ